MNRLINIGFISVGHWTLESQNIRFNLISHHRTKNVLYSFICNGEIKYIGKTTNQLAKRMNGYQNPGPTQSTNIRVNAIIRKVLQEKNPIDIFILADTGLLRYGDFKINLAAGLEDTLIYEICPEWNYSGKNKIKEDVESEKPELTKEALSNAQIAPAKITFDVTLGQAYYNQGFFNIRQQFSELIGTDKSTIEIQLGSNTDKVIQGYINRTANNNGTPRIMGGTELRNWIKKNFKQNDTIKIDIISPVSLRLQDK
jgi:hypothetical protein